MIEHDTPVGDTSTGDTARHDGSRPYPTGSIEVEQHGTVLLGRICGSPRGELVPGVVGDLAGLVKRAENDPDVHGVVLTGTHPDRFIAHASIPWLQQGGANTPDLTSRTASAVVNAAEVVQRVTPPLVQRTALKDVAQLHVFHETLFRINHCGVVFVAALNGSALGGGYELALSCDFRIMADGDYRLGQPEILLGIIPGGGGTQRLPRLIGAHRGLRHLLEGAGMSPAEALACGAVDQVVPQAELVDEALRMATHFGTRDKAAVGAIKRAVYFGGSMELEDGLAHERAEFLQIVSSPRGQKVMLSYQESTETHDELPLYRADAYQGALHSGSFPVTPY